MAGWMPAIRNGASVDHAAVLVVLTQESVGGSGPELRHLGLDTAKDRCHAVEALR